MTENALFTLFTLVYVEILKFERNGLNVVTEQPEVESNETEETHKAPRGGNLEEGSRDETGPKRTTYQKVLRDWCYSTNHNTDPQKFSFQDIATSRPEKVESDWKLTTEEDDSVDERVTIIPEEDGIHKTVRPV